MSTFNELIDFTRSTTATYLDSVVYGDEVVTNGDFSDGLSGWSTSNTNATNTITVNNGAVTMVGDGTVALNLQQVNVFTVNKEYRLTVDATVNAGNVGGIKLQYGGTDSSIGIITESGSYSFTFRPTSTTLDIFRRVGGEAINITIDNISVKEVIGGQVSGTPLLRTAAVDEPRLEYDAQGNALGLLIEEARTNHVTQSAVTSADWDKIGEVTTTDREDNALGVFNGTSVTSSGDLWSRVRRNITVTSGTVYSGTFFYKQGTSERVRLVMRANSLESVISGEQGSIATVSNSAGVISVESEEDYGGIRKVTFKWTAIYTGSAEIGLGAGSTTLGEDVILYAVQLEAGHFPTSYIPTEASTVTRTSEGARVTLSKFHYRQKHGAIVIEFTSKYDETASNFHRPWELGNLATDVNRIFMYVTGPQNRLTSSLYDNNVDQFFSVLTTALPNNTGVYSKAAITWQTDDGQSAYNGSAVGSDTTVALTQERDTLAIMGRPHFTNNRLSGHVKSIQYYPLRLVEERLEAVTA